MNGERVIEGLKEVVNQASYDASLPMIRALETRIAMLEGRIMSIEGRTHMIPYGYNPSVGNLSMTGKVPA